MSFKSNLLKAAGIGAAGILLTAGAAFAATATASVNVRTGPGDECATPVGCSIRDCTRST